MQINLIYEEEQRSATEVSPWLIVKLILAIILVLGIVEAVSFTTQYHTLQGDVKAATEEWQRTEPKYKIALQVRADLGADEAILKELQLWQKSRIEWGEQMGALRPIVPSVIQLTELHVMRNVGPLSNKVQAVFEMKLAGRTSSDRSEANLVQFLDGFNQPVFAEYVGSAILPPGAFRQDPENKADRMFDIVCKYNPRPLE